MEGSGNPAGASIAKGVEGKMAKRRTLDGTAAVPLELFEPTEATASMPTAAPPRGWNPVEVPKPPFALEQESLVEIAISCLEGMWHSRLCAMGEGGELLVEDHRQGFITAEGLKHSGWLLAAVDATDEVRRLGLQGQVRIRIPDPVPVGFLVVTLPAREQAATWDESVRSLQWPALYRTFLELKTLLNPRILWVPGSSVQ